MEMDELGARDPIPAAAGCAHLAPFDRSRVHALSRSSPHPRWMATSLHARVCVERSHHLWLDRLTQTRDWTQMDSEICNEWESMGHCGASLHVRTLHARHMRLDGCSACCVHVGRTLIEPGHRSPTAALSWVIVAEANIVSASDAECGC